MFNLMKNTFYFVEHVFLVFLQGVEGFTVAYNINNVMKEFFAPFRTKKKKEENNKYILQIF
jgi:hypothetical protein